MTEKAPAIDGLLAEHAALERQLADPKLHADAGAARKVGRRFAQISPIVATYRKLEAARGDLEAARECYRSAAASTGLRARPGVRVQMNQQVTVR